MNVECLDSYGSLQDLLSTMIQSTTESTRNFLTYAATLGTRLDENILVHLTSGSFSLHLQVLATNGWIRLDDTNDCWKFSHDAIKEAAYHMIPMEDRNAFHYRCGRKLWRKLSLDVIDQYIFLVVGQLIYGIDIVTVEGERTAIAKLCLRAGERAVELSHFENAFEYLSKGITFLGWRGWRDNYELCLRLHNAGAEVAFCTGDHDLVYNLVDETINNCRSVDDAIQAHCAKIYSLGSNGQLRNAISYGLLNLKILGEPFPTRCKSVRLRFELRNVRKRTRRISDTEMLRLPIMRNQSKLAAMKIMNAISLYMILADPEHLPFLCLRIVRVSLEYGLNGISSGGFVLYGAFLAR
jgi:predicted ATPase